MATITLDKLHKLTESHRKEIAAKLKALHIATDAGGDPLVTDAVNDLHTALWKGDTQLLTVMNRDTARAQPLDGGDGGNKKPA